MSKLRVKQLNIGKFIRIFHQLLYKTHFIVITNVCAYHTINITQRYTTQQENNLHFNGLKHA